MRKLILILATAALGPLDFRPAGEPPNALVYDWPSWGGDEGGQRYSPLKQIDKSNVGRLRRAWTFHTGEISDGKTYPTKSAFECTPIVLDGVMYITTPFCRVVALDPETGKELWSFDPKMDRMQRRNLWANDGLDDHVDVGERPGEQRERRTDGEQLVRRDDVVGEHVADQRVAGVEVQRRLERLRSTSSARTPARRPARRAAPAPGPPTGCSPT